MKIRATIIFVIIFLLSMSVCAFAASDKVSVFSDTSGHWAEEVIYECKAGGLISGYPDNTFKPGQSLSKVEALVLINKGLGWGKEAETISTSGMAFPVDLWKGFRGNVAVAVEKGLISKDDILKIKFNSPASRLEVAIWFAKALNLSGTYTNLNFTDTSGVSQEYKAMLAGVVEVGIMTGFPNNLFKPDNSLTRAEMSSVLSRLLQNGKMAVAEGSYVKGKVTSINTNEKKLSVDNKEYTMAGSNIVYKNTLKIALVGLSVGDKVRMVLDEDNTVLYIVVSEAAVIDKEKKPSTPSTTNTYGHVVNKYADYFTVYLNNGYLEEIDVDYVTFTKNNSSVSYNSLSKGMPVTVVKVGDKIKEIQIGTGSRKLFGTVSSTSSGILELKDYESKISAYSVDDDVEILNDKNKKIDWEDIEDKQGLELILDSSGNLAKIIVGKDAGEIFGTIISIKRAGNKKITIENEDTGMDYTYSIADDVVVKKDNTDKNLTDLSEDMDVELILDSDDLVTGINIIVDSSETISGEVTNFKTTGNKSITIEDSDGDKKAYYLDEDIVIQKGSTEKLITYVKVGMEVELTIDRDDKVLIISIEDDITSKIEGEVVYVKSTGNQRIIIEDEDGDLGDYYLSESIKIKMDGSYVDVEDIEEGMEVTLTLDADDEVTKIEIEEVSSSSSGSVVKGVITYVKDEGNYRLTIIDDDKTTYYFDDDYSIKEGVSNRKMSYLEVGMDVTLILNNKNEIIQINIIGDDISKVSGEVIYVKTSGSKKIEIEKSKGKEYSYDISSEVTVIDGDSIVKLSSIDDGMDVILYIDENEDDEVVQIEID